MTHISRVFGCGLLAAAALAATPAAQAVTINFSSLEQVLADPDDMMSMKGALWTGWATQIYENNMPFIEIGNEADAPSAITQFTMTIGDTDYQFSNEFLQKANTNSFPFPADGSYAITGFSTPDVAITSSVTNGGDTLVVQFPDGLQPGEVVRFQVDINKDASAPDAAMFAPYSSVFFASPNSDVRIDFENPDLFAEATLPDLAVSPDVAAQLANPRPYTEMQQIDLNPDIEVDVVPEPSSLLVALLGVAIAARRRVA